MQKLEATGERMLPEMRDPSILIEHLHRYALAKQFCQGKIVLDIASGEGYGSSILSSVAQEVIGVDIDVATVNYASNKYKNKNLSFKTGRADSIPVMDGYIDVVVSFETLEHHDKHREMFAEVKRVLKKDGILIISTPDKKYYSDLPNYKNPFHVKELYKDEFFSLVTDYFPFVKKIGQSAGITSVLFPLEEKSVGSSWSASGDETNLVIQNSLPSLYLIAIASQSPVNYASFSFFDGSVIKERTNLMVHNEIQRLHRSPSFLLGRLLLSPLRWVKNSLKGKR